MELGKYYTTVNRFLFFSFLNSSVGPLDKTKILGLDG